MDSMLSFSLVIFRLLLVFCMFIRILQSTRKWSESILAEVRLSTSNTECGYNTWLGCMSLFDMIDYKALSSGVLPGNFVLEFVVKEGVV